MICRQLTLDDGSCGWLLIPQVQHARLSGQVARHWGAAPFVPVPVPHVTLPAICHHDDGWNAWDQVPRWNETRGHPLSFMEMRPGDLDTIWGRSVRAVAPWGPLAQMMVARHFCELRGTSSDPDGSEESGFVRQYQPLWQRWLRQWTDSDPDRNLADLADLAFRCLKFFDLLSLWLCCEPEMTDASLETPWREAISWRWTSPWRAEVRPWAWRMGTLQLSVEGYWLPMGPYGSQAEMDSEPRRPMTVTWVLQPG